MKLSNNFFKRAHVASIALFLSLSVAGTHAQAQCLTPHLNISSGYDPMAGGPVVPSNTQLDPKWTSAVSTHAAAAILANGDIIDCYDALPLAMWGTPLGGTTFMMGQNNWGHFTDGIPGHQFIDTFTREFTLCEKDSVVLVIDSMISDDWLSALYFDGTLLQAYPMSGGINHYPGASYSLGVITGTHTIRFVLNNLNNGNYLNAIGLDVRASIVSVAGINSIVDETCPGYTCEPVNNGCDDKCYWRVTGNNIIGTNNIFGTLTKDDIRIVTNGTQRGVVLKSGEFGIHQPAPSTTLDVDCVPPSTAPSGLQFENLPFGQGNILVVDAAGYVYLSQSTARPAGGADLQTQVDELKKQVEELKALLSVNSGQQKIQDGNSLVVSPNPSDGDINATYSINGSFSKAVIRVTDNMGRVVLSSPIEGNNGIQHISIPSSVKSSTLIVSMIVDGNMVTSKQLSFLTK